MSDNKLITKRTVKELVSGNKKVRFTRFFDSNLWYTTDCGFEFPVPIDDVGTATMLAEDKAMLFMRYIRKHLDMIKIAQNDLATE